MKDIVSIITPVYNCGKYIGETIESVLKQSYQNWEMIVVDDCSTDNSAKIIKEYMSSEPRIKYFKLDKNSGAAVARNTAIEHAKGRFIAFLDSDDLWHPDKLKKQIEFMKKNNYAFTFTGFQQINEEGQLLNKYMPALKKINYKKALYTNYIGCLTAVYDVSKLGKVYMPLIRKRQDYGLWLKILKKVDYGYGLDKSLAYYRVRNGSVSSNKLSLIRYQWQLYRDIEELAIMKSIFYISYTVILKLLNMK